MKRIALLALALLLVPGCALVSRSEAKTTTKRDYDFTAMVPLPYLDGTTGAFSMRMTPVPVRGQVFEESETTTDGGSTLKPDGAAVGGALGALANAALQQAVPGLSAVTGGGWTADRIATTTAAVVAALGLAVGGVKATQAKRAERDSDEGWRKYEEAQRRAEQYAHMAPPPPSSQAQPA
jgi:hypothetical protein